MRESFIKAYDELNFQWNTFTYVLWVFYFFKEKGINFLFVIDKIGMFQQKLKIKIKIKLRILSIEFVINTKIDYFSQIFRVFSCVKILKFLQCSFISKNNSLVKISSIRWNIEKKIIKKRIFRNIFIVRETFLMIIFHRKSLAFNKQQKFLL